MTGEIGIDMVGGVPGALVVILMTASTLDMTSTFVLALSAELLLTVKNALPEIKAIRKARQKVERAKRLFRMTLLLNLCFIIVIVA